MRKNRIISICVIILMVLVLCSGCIPNLQDMENAELRQSTEAMLDALIANDFKTAYTLVKNICTEDDFQSAFTQMKDFLKGADTYELQLLYVSVNTNIINGHRTQLVSSVYEMTTENNRIIVSVNMDDQIGINSFYLTPYENTDYYSTGTLTNMKDATLAQWVFLLLNVIAIGFAALALVDCCRQKIKNKPLWILLLILGFASFGATLSPTVFRINFNLGWITAYSALIRYGSGAVMIRLMLPVGAIIYCMMRKSLLLDHTQTITTPNIDPENLEANCTDQQPSPTSEEG